MSNLIDNSNEQGTKFETPLAIRHVESHLFFGPISRHLPLSYFVLTLVILYCIADILTSDKSIGSCIKSIAIGLMLFIFALRLIPMTKRQQAIAIWTVTKGMFGLIAVMLATLGAGLSFLRGQADAWPNLILGLIWIPGIEFIPRVTPHQRYVTFARIVFSVPCIYFGIKSGNWHW